MAAIQKRVERGIAAIKATFNNTKITITDQKGNVLTWSSAGQCGFKGARKSTPFAATQASKEAAEKAIEKYGLVIVDATVKGPGPGRDSAIRALQAAGLKVYSISDITPIPHNGCKPKKRRRV